MKILNKILMIGLVVMISACSTDLDLLDNPNEVTPENANIDDLFNSVQLNFATNQGRLWFTPGGMARMISFGGAYDYTSGTNPNFFNGLWFGSYASMFPDIDAIEALASERGLNFHSGGAKILKSITLTQLVDMFGDVPFTQAGDGTGTISPVADSGADVYAAADALLDEAIALLAEPGPAPANDLVYGGDASKWIKLAKTLKLRNAVTTRLVNSNAAATINALVAEGDIITSTADDFQVQYAVTRQNPGSRHPLYYNMYESGDGSYMSNYYMWLLKGEKTNEFGDPVEDPRIRFYFYRKTPDAAGLDPNVYSCHFSNLPTQIDKPAHYASVDPRIPYCIAAPDGYFGRDHLNAEGIPPDGQFRTAYGLYPVGGQFDDNSFSNTQNEGTTGGLGQGIEPLLLASFVDFLRAEAALTVGTSDDARALLESGVRKSIAKVFSFAALVPSTMSRGIVDVVTGDENPVSDVYVPSAAKIDEYVALVLSNYDAADDKLDVVMKEYYIALWGNGFEAYNMYRRTGKPNNMAPALEPNPGPFIRSFFLPGDHVNRNANAEQKELTEPVFWDNNPATLTY